MTCKRDCSACSSEPITQLNVCPCIANPRFIFVAPGVIAQTQPKFIANRDVFEAREKKAKFYSWQAFCFGEIVAEVPYLLVCAFLYFICWYVAPPPPSAYPCQPVLISGTP